MTEEQINKIKKRADEYATACFPYEKQFLEREAVVKCCTKVVEEATKEFEKEKLQIISNCSDREEGLRRKIADIEAHIEELKKQINWKEKALAKLKRENGQKIHRVTKDNKRLIRRNTELKAQIEKMESRKWSNF